MSWIVSSVLVGANLIASYDANKSAKHQAAAQADLQRWQLQQQQNLAAMEMAETARLQEQQIAAQRQMQSASLAAAERQAAESKAQMDKQLKAAEEAANRANMKRPNTARIVAEASQAGRSGASGTMLTGPQGVDTSMLTLGRNSLLGQ